MSEQQRNNRDSAARRKLLMGIAGGGVAGVAGLTQWKRPIVESVTLPAHAATSVASLARYSLVGGVVRNATRQESHRYADGGNSSLLDAIVPRAHATIPMDSNQYVLIEKPGGRYDFYGLSSETSSEDCIFEILSTASNLTLGGSAPLNVNYCDGGSGTDGNAVLEAVSESSATVVLYGETNLNLLLDPGASPLSVTPCPCINAE